MGGSFARMRLVRAGVRGYKRFAESAEMNVDGRVVAVVGPNEAGKTSFLTGLTHLSRSGELSAAEWTRGRDRPAQEVAWARFLSRTTIETRLDRCADSRRL